MQGLQALDVNPEIRIRNLDDAYEFLDDLPTLPRCIRRGSQRWLY